MGLDHEVNDGCKERFKRFSEYMETGVEFRDKVVKHEQQILTLEQSASRYYTAIDDLNRSVRGIEKGIANGVLTVVLALAVFLMTSLVSVGVYINKVNTLEKMVDGLQEHKK